MLEAHVNFCQIESSPLNLPAAAVGANRRIIVTGTWRARSGKTPVPGARGLAVGARTSSMYLLSALGRWRRGDGCELILAVTTWKRLLPVRSFAGAVYYLLGSKSAGYRSGATPPRGIAGFCTPGVSSVARKAQPKAGVSGLEEAWWVVPEGTRDY